METTQAELQAQMNAINAAYAFIEFDAQGNILNANDIFLKTMGYALPEIQGRHHSLFITKEYAQSSEYQLFWDNLRVGKAQINTFQRINKLGDIVWLDASYAPVFDEVGKVYKVIKLAKDVTTQKILEARNQQQVEEIRATEEELRQNLEELASTQEMIAQKQVEVEQTAQKFNDILEGCLDGVVVIDAHGIISFFNSSAEKMWGYTRDEVAGKNVKMLMPHAHAEKHDQYLHHYTETHHAKIIGIGREEMAIRKDGSAFPIHLTVSEAKSAKGSVFTGFVRDITSELAMRLRNQQQVEELRATEEEMRQNMEELQATQERQYQLSQQLQKSQAEIQAQFNAINGAYAFIEFDPQGNILQANDIFLQTMGYTLPEIQGKHHRIFVSAAYSQSFEYQNFWEQLRAGKAQISFFERINKTGELIWLDASYAPVFDEAGIVTKVIKLAKDVTLQKTLEARNQQQLEELRATEEEMRQNMEELQATQERQHQLTLQLQKAQSESDAQLRAINASYAFIEFDIDGYVLSANPIFLETMGYLMSEIQGRHHKIFVTQEYAQTNEYQEFWNDLRNGRTRTALYQRIARNGTTVWLEASYSPVLDEEGKVLKVIKLAKNVTNFTQALKATANFLQELKNGNFEAILDLPTHQMQGEIAQMADANIALRDTLRTILAEINRVVRLAGKEGKLSERLQVTQQKGAWQEVTNSLNDLLKNIAEPIWEMQEVITRLSMGDLTTTYTGKAQGDIADMAKALNVAIQSLNQLVGKINQNAQTVAQYAQKLTEKATAMRYTTADASTAIQQMADGAQDQASRTDEASRLVEKTLSASLLVHQKADTINQTAEKNGKICQDGLQSVGQLTRNMRDIADSVSITNNAIEVLTNRSEEISRILNLINEIAFQTNLLALNAKIEAARAGDAGRGFGVVADEIGKLADDARRSTVDIDKLIKDVQKDINTSGKAIDKMKQSVQSGEEATANTTKIFEEINVSGQTTLTLSQTIVTSALEQKESIGAVVKNIEKIVVVAEQTASGTQEVANSAREMDKAMLETSQTSEQLLQIAEELKKQVGQFKS
jgi:methyl-accepting chemotaxis protein